EDFGRDINDYTETIRTNKLTLSKSWDQYSFNAETRWDDNVVNRSFKDTDDTLQRLPSIEFSGSKQGVWEDSWLHWGLDSGYNYFYRIDGQQGHRTDLYPRFYVPLRLGNYFSFEPSVGVRETAWYVTDPGGEEKNPDDMLHREIYDLKLDLSTEIYRIFNAGWMNIDKIRHAIKPQVIYTFVPELDQSEYPYFDEVDRLERDNRITYSITNTFTSRTTVKQSPQSGKGDNEEERIYKKFCRFKLEQSYDINKGHEDHPEPFSAVLGELELYPHRYFTLDAEASWNQYTNRFTRHIVTAGISDDRGDRFLAEHIREGDETESIKFSLIVTLTNQFLLYSDLERDLKEKKDIETGISLLYKSGCWSADFGRTETREDISYSLLVSLNGLGGLGSSVRPD
ncbi:MAG: LPS assembly protein LptD, partial [Deltaproteobacteria bacterium]|nr:LPS assembly protein LptD [Deltaproteobacteria bacterium]